MSRYKGFITPFADWDLIFYCPSSNLGYPFAGAVARIVMTEYCDSPSRWFTFGAICMYRVEDVCVCADKDGDGHYAVSGWCPQGDDCDDNDPEVYPGEKELCNGKDNDCNGQIDDLCPLLPVPLFKQCAFPWGEDIYDHSASTICKEGCALTSAVMVLRYYGITTGIDGKEVTPGNLNEWLKRQPDGFIQGYVNWAAVYRYSGGKVSFSIVKDRDDELLNKALCNGQPVILNVSSRRGHFVVATGAMCADNKMTWAINDPGYNITTLQGYGNTYLGLRMSRAQ